MESRCTLCDGPMPEGGYVLGTVAMTTGGSGTSDPMCVRCVTLPAEQRKPLRDKAMVRMLSEGNNSG